MRGLILLVLLLLSPVAFAGPAEDLANAIDALPRSKPMNPNLVYRILPDICDGTTETRCVQVYSLMEPSTQVYCSTILQAPACTQKESPQ